MSFGRSLKLQLAMYCGIFDSMSFWKSMKDFLHHVFLKCPYVTFRTVPGVSLAFSYNKLFDDLPLSLFLGLSTMPQKILELTSLFCSQDINHFVSHLHGCPFYFAAFSQYRMDQFIGHGFIVQFSPQSHCSGCFHFWIVGIGILSFMERLRSRGIGLLW